MIANEVIKVLNELITKIQGPAEHVYKIMVRQAYISGILSVLGSLILMVITAGCGFAVYKYYKYTQSDDYSYLTDKYDWMCALAWLVGIVGAIGSAFVFCTGLQRLLNPEYYAIMSLLGK